MLDRQVNEESNASDSVLAHDVSLLRRADVRSRRRSPHFGRLHPVAGPARRRCVELHPHRALNGVVACGECFEHAIRADERAVLLFDLPREIEPDPDYVDEVAVERAVAGDRVPLTEAELAAAAAVLTRRGWTGDRIGTWLGIAPYRLRPLVSAAPPAAAEAGAVSGATAGRAA